MQVTKGNYEKETRCEESSEEGQGGSGGARTAARRPLISTAGVEDRAKEIAPK